MTSEDSSDELAEAQESEAATRQILRVIRQSRATPQPVFDTIASAAMNLCRATVCNGRPSVPDRQRAHELTVVCGMRERDGDGSRGTLYNTVVTIGPDGKLPNVHRS